MMLCSIQGWRVFPLLQFGAVKVLHDDLNNSNNMRNKREGERRSRAPDH